MSTTIYLEDDDLKQLDRISEEANISREPLIEQLVRNYIRTEREKVLEAAFGLWKDRPEDGLAYQQRLRSEWPA